MCYHRFRRHRSVSQLTVVTLHLDVGFTGIDQEYEHPSNPELILKAGELSVDECVQQLVQLLATRVCHYVFLIVE